jgi:hypothetical protein
MTETLTHALTIHQPCAWAICAGHKLVENRTWRPPLEMVGKLIGIHAGKGLPKSWSFPSDVHVPDAQHLVYGALIGVARLVGVVRACIDLTGGTGGRFAAPSYELMHGASVGVPVRPELAARIRPWWRGPWGWLLEEAVLLPEPIPMRGQQGVWRIPPVVAPATPRPFVSTWTDPAGFALEQWRKAREGA